VEGIRVFLQMSDPENDDLLDRIEEIVTDILEGRR
jgi:hypothetical protein